MSADLTAIPPEKTAAHQRMARVIVALLSKNGDCLPQDLLPHGFTKDETVDLWRVAYAIACDEFKPMKIGA